MEVSPEKTMTVFTSDHSDYLGDHWLGEKEMFHEISVKIQLINYDPSEEADATRGKISEALVESINLVPTFVEFVGGEAKSNIRQGKSLLPNMRDANHIHERRVVIAEYDYSVRRARRILDQPIPDCKLIMAFDGRWKYIYLESMAPILCDLESDPYEIQDLGLDPAYKNQMQRLGEAIFKWSRKPNARVTPTDAQIAARACGEFKRGILILFWDDADIADASAMAKAATNKINDWEDKLRWQAPEIAG